MLNFSSEKRNNMYVLQHKTRSMVILAFNRLRIPDFILSIYLLLNVFFDFIFLLLISSYLFSTRYLGFIKL